MKNPFDRERQKERDFYRQTQEYANMDRTDMNQPKMKAKTEASSKWLPRIGALAVTLGLGIFVPVMVQYFAMTVSNLGKADALRTGFWHDYGLGKVFLLWVLVGCPIAFGLLYKQFYAIWYNNNHEFLQAQFKPFANDAYLRAPDHIIREFDAAPDAGLGFDGHVSSLVAHMMISNKGIKEIDMPVLDPDREGQVAVDKNGQVVRQKMKMFDKDFARELYKFSNVPRAMQHWYDATDYAFNERNSKKEAKHGNARKGAFGRKEYDTLADYINGEFYPLPTDTQRPAGVYFYDSRPVNTILIAITRGGKANGSWLVGRPASPRFL